MSLFRRPRRRACGQTRAAAKDDDVADEPPPQKHPPPPLPPPKMLLSFVDEVEDETEVFRVKKSSYSKKLQKQKDREKRVKNEREDAPIRSSEARNSAQLSNGVTTVPEDDDSSKNSRKNHNLTKGHRSVEGLILSGRAALVAGSTGDISGSDNENSDTDNNVNSRFKPVFRPQTDSVRALLDKGVIPDAAIIHAARKKRQQAREVGDYIPIQHTNADNLLINQHSTLVNHSGKREGRLVREDGEGDASDEDPDRIDVKGVAPETSRKERIKIAKEEGTASDPDSGGEEWEAQQIRKAVTQNQIIAVQQETYYNTNYMLPMAQYSEPEMNPFTIASIPVSACTVVSEHLKPLVQNGDAFLSVNELTGIIQNRLDKLHEFKEKQENDLLEMNKELDSLQDTCYSCTQRAPVAASRYEFYQKLRGYLTDLIECLDEKMPTLNTLEARAMTLHKRKASFICERRRADVRDQAHDVLQTAGGNVKKDPVDEERRRRCAEREGRRLRRRRAREQLVTAGTPINHRDGDSSDDEVPHTESAAYETIQEQILVDADALFSDTLDEFSSLASVLSHLEDWKYKDNSAYIDAYVSLCLPRLAGPFLRLKLLLWNPIADEKAPDWDKMQWYRGLMLYGLREDINNPENEDVLRNDPDLCLIPNIIQKVILPKITELVDGTWDPMSSAQTRRLASLLRRAGSLPGATPNNHHYTDLAKAVLNRIRIALQHDVFIPILPKSVIDSGPRGGSAFLKRQAAAGVRLLSNLVTLCGTIADSSLAPLILESLLQRYLLAAIRCSPPVFSADLCWTIATCLPKPWIEQELCKLALQQFFTCCQEVLSNLADNIMNLKAIEQIRATITLLTPVSKSKK